MKRAWAWLRDTESNWLWVVWCLCWAAVEGIMGWWWTAAGFAVGALVFACLCVSRVRLVRRVRVAEQRIAEAQARFYWRMGQLGVPLPVVRRADQLLDDGRPGSAHALILEHIS